jgi:uncharacterized protein DUF4129
MDAGRPVDGGPDRTWRLGLAGGALVAVVAIVSRSSLFHDRRHDDGFGRAAGYVLGGIFVLALAFGVVITLHSLRGGGMKPPPRRSSWRTLLLTLLLIGAVAVAAPLFRAGSAQRNDSPSVKTITSVSIDCGSPCPSQPRSPGSSPWWIVLAAGVLVSALLVAGARASKGAVRENPLPNHERARSLFDASLDDLLAEPDPRRAIAMAYRRLLDGLAACGLARADAETPYEHLARALAELDVAPEPLARLTSLFSEARFSDHVLTSVHKDVAIEAFRAARDGLAPHVDHARS